jgi:hypothetical protein
MQRKQRGESHRRFISGVRCIISLQVLVPFIYIREKVGRGAIPALFFAMLLCDCRSFNTDIPRQAMSE